MIKTKVVIALFIFIQLILLGWASRLLTEWGTDFGVYYSGAYFLEENYRLYQEFFDHKGPIFYLFLKLVGYFIGWGHLQAFFSLYLVTLVFFIPAFFIIVNEIKSPNKINFILLITLLLITSQNSNSSISFFQGGLLISSFYLLITAKSSYIKLFFSLIIYWLAILTRIDALIFAPVFIWILISEIIYGRSVKIIALLFLVSFFYLLIFVSIAKFFDFGISEFLQHNIDFNKWYRGEISLKQYFYRPSHFGILFSSLLAPVFILANPTPNKILSSIKKINIVIFFNDGGKINKNLSNIVLTLIVASALFLWVIAGSDKNYHLLTLTIPLIFLIWIKNDYFGKYSFNIFIYIFGFYSLAVSVLPPIYILVKDQTCISTPFCKSSAIIKYVQTIESIKKSQMSEVTIVGGRGWTYFFSLASPARAINDWWLYERKDYFPTEKLILAHKKLLVSNSGYIFWIDNSLLEVGRDENSLLNEILNRAYFIENQGQYSMYSIK